MSRQGFYNRIIDRALQELSAAKQMEAAYHGDVGGNRQRAKEIISLVDLMDPYGE